MGTKEQQPGKAPALEVRMCVEQLRNPFWYESKERRRSQGSRRPAVGLTFKIRATNATPFMGISMRIS